VILQALNKRRSGRNQRLLPGRSDNGTLISVNPH
jgi:hypothetical protein